ncbi:MAG: UDP-N-acetylmuramoyl-L-alanyl-D-glutamate--2,6-diaminopimelate ligase [Candidatus Pacebacteria bacterium]|nr:UDP-N-acetylmuramoyl-L-alanyl-D-glutamate--2,6-diaminopimelate ligase [Candidatus Paceibacterota bacterium]
MKPIKKQLKTIWWRGKSIGAMYYYGNPSKKLKVVGVTGTNGKTTIATLLYKITTALGYKTGLISTVENIIVDKAYPSIHTTPDSVTLTKLFHEMLEKGCEYVFMEVSSHALDQNRVWGVNFVGGIFTNLTHDHLDYHKTFENYFAAKKKFFQMLPPRAFALTNADNEYGLKMLDGIKTNKFSYGFKPVDNPTDVGRLEGSRRPTSGNLFQGEIKKLDFNGLELLFNDILIKSKLLGKFNAYNLLAVWSACSLLGFDMQKVNKILENIEPPRGRFEHFTSTSGVLVVVDYAHTPDALEKILLAIHEIKPEKGRIISVFGCGGDRDPIKRKIMGSIGATLSDIAIFTSDNPRSEDPDKIIEQMKEGLTSEELKKVKTIPNRHEAIKEAVKIAVRGDIVLCAGKGHEDYQEIKGVKHHFDDVEEFKQLFNY